MSFACTSWSTTFSPRTCRARKEISSRYSAPARFGMPIRKISRTGISPKGIGREQIATTMTRAETAFVRACGKAMPPGNKGRSACCRSKTVPENSCKSWTCGCPWSVSSILEIASCSDNAFKSLMNIAARKCSTAFRLITQIVPLSLLLYQIRGAGKGEFRAPHDLTSSASGFQGCDENGPAAVRLLPDRSRIGLDMLPPTASPARTALPAAHFDRNKIPRIAGTGH
jgi:hypothetical protein